MEVAGCALCGRPTFDPGRGERPWARAVRDRAVALVCPTCQHDRPEWPTLVQRCSRCESTRLSVALGEVICRECGTVGALEARQFGQ